MSVNCYQLAMKVMMMTINEDNDTNDGGNDDDGGWQGINGLVIKASVDVTLDAVSTLNCSTSHYPTLHLKRLNCPTLQLNTCIILHYI